MTTEEGNKIIAEYDLHIKTSDLHYHDSWNRLMPVVEKIEAKGWVVEIWTKKVDIRKPFEKDESKIVSSDSKIKATWLAVIEFINWYNKNKS